MLILNQKRTKLINLDNVISIVKETTLDESNAQYWADTATNDTIKLGEYANTPEHENQLERIAQCIGAASVYKMPEE